MTYHRLLAPTWLEHSFLSGPIRPAKNCLLMTRVIIAGWQVRFGIQPLQRVTSLASPTLIFLNDDSK